MLINKYKSFITAFQYEKLYNFCALGFKFDI